MTAVPFFHVGFLVHDLEAAMERFGDVFDVRWTSRTVTHSRFWEPGRGTIDFDLEVVYSVEGPPHIELVQSTGDGLYAASRGEGFHHIGAWATHGRDGEFSDHPSLDRVAAQFNGANEIIVSHFDPQQLHGVMLEVVDDRRREMMERWFHGGPFVD